MESLRIYLKKTLAFLNKVGHGISYVWFLFPVIFYYGLRGTWHNMETSPKVTDSYFDILFWTFLFFIIALVFLFRRHKPVQFCLAVLWES